MRKKLSLLLLAAFTSLPFVSAQNGVFPEIRTNTDFGQQPNKVIQKVSPNADKERGVLMYATSLDDYSRERGWYRIRANEPGSAEKLKTWAPGSDSKIDGLRCGSWGGDTYYAYYVYQYDLGMDYPKSFVKVDVETGELETVVEFKKGDDLLDNWRKYVLYCMTYNPVEDEVYAFGQTTLSDRQVTSLYTIDRKTGTPHKVHDFDFISFGMAVDMNGNLWVQKSIYENDVNVGTKLVCMDTKTFEVKKEVSVSHDGKDFVTQYYGTMSFDYTTGDLYWIALRKDLLYDQLFKVNLEDGSMESTGTVWSYMVGMYIPYEVPDKPEVPAKVIDLAAKPDMTGAMKSTLTWTNPSLQWNKDPLKDMTNVEIYKKGSETPVATVDAAGKVGAQMEWTDENAVAGINTYYVIPCNEYGKGVKDSINVYVGEDLPGQVTNITIENSGESVTLSWDVPEIGLNEGYVNVEGLKYTIVRYPDEVEVAKEISERTFTDSNFEEQECYYYTIQAISSKGEGEIAETEMIVAGKPYTTPVSFNFAEELNSKIWTNAGAWEWSPGVQKGDERMITTITERNGNWLISPDLALEGGKTYKVVSTIKTDVGPVGCLYDFKFAMGQGKTADAMTNVIYEEKDHVVNNYYYVETFENYIDIAETGTYNYGIEVSKITGGDTFSFLGMSIEEVYDADMEAVELTGFIDAIYNYDNTCKLVVRNKGKNAASNYKVKVARIAEDGSLTVLGETSEVPAIEPYATAEVEITYRPDSESDMEIVGIVEIEGDGNEENNMTEKYPLTVLPEGIVGFNRLITNEEAADHDTRVPLSFITDQSMSQTLYYASEIKAETDSWIQRVAFQYAGNEITAVLGPVSVKIYMCNTDKEIYSSEKDAISIDEMQLVYEGEVTINPGTNTMAFILSEEFEYSKDKNLCVAVVKTGLVGNDYPALFETFRTSETECRTVFQDNITMNYWHVPVLQLAVKEKGGIEKNIEIGASAIWYDAASSSLNFSDNSVENVYVYDFSGKMVGVYNVAEGASSLPVDLASGLYVVRTVNAEDAVNTAKISVLK